MWYEGFHHLTLSLLSQDRVTINPVSLNIWNLIYSSRSSYQMLIDKFMPLYHFNEVQSIVVGNESRNYILSAVRNITSREIPFLFELFWLRGLPSSIILRKIYNF